MNRLDIIQNELSILIPKELSVNIDYQNQILQNIKLGSPYVPYGFNTYLSNKYGYDIDIIRHKEIQKMIFDISSYLHKNPDPKILQNILKDLSAFPGPNIDTKKYTNMYRSKPKKSRNDLAKEIPLADFLI